MAYGGLCLSICDSSPAGTKASSVLQSRLVDVVVPDRHAGLVNCSCALVRCQ